MYVPPKCLSVPTESVAGGGDGNHATRLGVSSTGSAIHTGTVLPTSSRDRCDPVHRPLEPGRSRYPRWVLVLSQIPDASGSVDQGASYHLSPDTTRHHTRPPIPCCVTVLRRVLYLSAATLSGGVLSSEIGCRRRDRSPAIIPVRRVAPRLPSTPGGVGTSGSSRSRSPAVRRRTRRLSVSCSVRVARLRTP